MKNCDEQHSETRRTSLEQVVHALPKASVDQSLVAVARAKLVAS
jgi:hypothetical protein